MRRKYRAKLAGAEVRRVYCPEHGAYQASVLSIGGRNFPARCPQCRAADAMLEVERLKTDAISILTVLGRASERSDMARQRKRRDNDREFFVRLADKTTTARVAVGNFWAESEIEAISMAKREYPGLFLSMQTRNWSPEAELRAKKSEKSEPARSILG